MNQYPKRLIEVDLPIKKISECARRDQNVRKGHLHTMHVWWATRPLASCRAVTLATMLPDPADDNCPQYFREQAAEAVKQFTRKDLSDPMELRQALLNFIGNFADWDAGVDPKFLAAARKLVAAAHPEGRPMVIDPFAGAGSIPFEALRIGADAFASDLNPIPVLMNKVALEYLPRYGRDLIEGVEKWGQWVLDRAREKLGQYYPVDEHGHMPLAYIWARTIRCEGPGCGAEVPLLGMLWLSKKAKNLVALHYHGNPKTKQVEIEIFQPKSADEVQSGIVKRMAATCPCCGYTTPYKSTREQLRQKRGGTRDARMIAVITLDQNGDRNFRLPNIIDKQAAEKASQDLLEIENEFGGPWSFVPYESTPSDGTLGYRINKYGMEQWADVYLHRQILSLGIFCLLVGEVHERIIQNDENVSLAEAISTCISLSISKTSIYNASTCYMHPDFGLKAVFLGSGVPMVSDFCEINPIMSRFVGSVEYSIQLMQAFIKRESGITFHAGTVQQGSAENILLPDDSVDYVITDPPYYDAVPYAALSDFCYIWLKRGLASIHPILFKKALTPKIDECIMDPGVPSRKGTRKDRQFFEKTMQTILSDARRVLRPHGICVIIFAHKSTAGWEAILNALISAGLTVTGSWPIDTENRMRWRAAKSATLSSSVHLVCRPREYLNTSMQENDVGDWRDVLAELPHRIHAWMSKLTQEGIVGADAIFACLGPALEIFSRYSRVEKASGEEVALHEYLEQVWAAVAHEALRMLFEGADTSAFEEDARLTAMWLWTLKTAENGNGRNGDEEAVSSGGYLLEYDAARKIAQGLGAHLDGMKDLVEIKGDKARLLPVDERSRHLFGKDDTPKTRGNKRDSKQLTLFEELDDALASDTAWGKGGAPNPGQTTLNRLHQAMLLFASGRGEALRRFLVDEGTGRDGRFWTLAQALSALYPSNTQEKRWVDGILARKKGMGF